MSAQELQQATGGHWRDGRMPLRPVTGIGTDSRAFRDGDAFLALRGARFDGHAHAPEVAHRASALIGDEAGARLWDDLTVPQLVVPDTLNALGDIAHAWRDKLTATTFIAISGSFGKTSLRTMLACLFGALGVRVAATRDNLNNLVGVPLTLLAVPEEAEVALIECGISEPGEMRRLSAMVEPDVAVLTGIAPAHGEGLGDMRGIAREKACLFDGLRSTGWLALGEGLAELLSALPPQPALKPGDAEFVHASLAQRKAEFAVGEERAELALALPARHWAANMALAMSIVRRWFAQQHRPVPSLQRMTVALSDWQPPAGRMRILEGRQGQLVLDDAYNANPASMQAALDTLRRCDGHRIAVLGDMAELGESSQRLHLALKLEGLDEVILIGPQMRALAARLNDVRWFADADAAAKALAGRRWPSDAVILLKASRAMGLERLLPVVLGKGGGDAV